MLRILQSSDLLPGFGSVNLTWAYNVSGANPLGSGSSTISYTAAIHIAAYSQIGILVFPSGATGSIANPVVARIQWSIDGYNFVEEKVEQPNAVAGGVQQFSAVIKEWGPNSTAWPIWRPVTAVYMKLGFYETGSPSAGDQVTCFIAMQAPDQIEASGT